MQIRKLRQFIIITIIILLKHDSVIRRENAWAPGGSYPHYLGLRNFRMNWSVCPRIVWSNTLAVRGSAGLARIELSESNLKPAASTSRRTVQDSMRCKVSVTFAGAPRAAE